ncbi:hypothetical protein GCM10029978_057160 [Actinoallomurus acanthiterrae]
MSDPVARPEELRSSGSGFGDRHTAAIGLLLDRGADTLEHPGGTLFAHLQRVEATLEAWGARPDLRLAGLCHAFYGTDGFATALGDPGDRTVLAETVGVAAERLVYFYASCDRARSLPHLTAADGPYVDRFSGAVANPPWELRRDFAELTVANELDVLAAAPRLREVHGPALLARFADWRPLLSAAARRAVHDFGR